MEGTFEIIEIHAGITENQIVERMNKIISNSKQNPKDKYFIFFDEVKLLIF